MAATIYGFKRSSPFLILAGSILMQFGAGPEHLSAQSQGAQANPPIIRSTNSQFSTIARGPISPSPAPLAPQVGKAGSGLNIIPTFNSNSMAGTAIDAATQTVINNAIAFYQSTFTNNITVNIEFHNMNTGLGQSDFFFFTVPYSTTPQSTGYCQALVASATSADDATALASITPCGSTNPINGTANIGVKSPNGRAIGINLQEPLIPTDSACPTPMFTGSGCIGLNVTVANNLGVLFAVVEHEIDEILGLGSVLQGATTPAGTDPWPEDLFRWTSVAGTRSFAANPGMPSAPCSGSTPRAFFSIDGGTTDLNEFNNCNNGGDYGDWITHNPPQVQDAFIGGGSGSPSLSVTSPEVRALDVMGYSIVVSKHRRGQIISQ